MNGLALLLGLPLELRQEIYSYLIPPKTTPKPIPNVGIASVTHLPPSPHMLVVDRRLTEELLEYFYSVATWKLILSHEFNYFRCDPTLSQLAAWPCLGRMQKVEIVFFCNVQLLKDYPSFGLERFCTEIQRRITRACEILASVQDLRRIKVSWIDTTATVFWPRIVDPLRLLMDKVEFAVGEMIGPDQIDMPKFVQNIEERLGIGALSDECRLSIDDVSRQDHMRRKHVPDLGSWGV